MNTPHPSGALQALYRVFILPTVPTLRPSPAARKHILPLQRLTNRQISTTRPRLAKTRAPEQRTQKWNEEIRGSHIYLVNPKTNELSDLRKRRDVMANLDKETHRLVQFDEQPEPNDPDGQKFPICKILGKKEMYQQEKNRKEAQKVAKKASATANSVKTLELNWAIDGNDLGHRLDRMKEFLEEGRKVEVVLAAKKAGRKASPAECEDVLSRIRGAVEAVPGAKEVKGLDGKLGGFCTILFQGKTPQAQGAGGQKGKGPPVAASAG